MNKIITTLLILMLVTIPKTHVAAAEKQLDENNLITTVSNLHSQLTENALSTYIPISTTQFSITIGTARAAEKATIVSMGTSQIAVYKQMAEQIVNEKFGKGHFKAFETIVSRESSWNPKAVNPRSGTCGFGQAQPFYKACGLSPKDQLVWMANYIGNRYGSPEKALAFHNRKGWY